MQQNYTYAQFVKHFCKKKNPSILWLEKVVVPDKPQKVEKIPFHIPHFFDWKKIFMLRSPWFLQLCKKQCTFFYRYVYVLQIRLLKHQYSKTVWSKLFLCNTYTNHIAVVKEVDLGFKLILYKYCFIIVKSILFQIWNIIRQYFLTPPNKNPISSPNPHSLSGWGCVELVQQLQYKTKVCFISWRSTDSFTIATNPTHYHLELARKLQK